MPSTQIVCIVNIGIMCTFMCSQVFKIFKFSGNFFYRKSTIGKQKRLLGPIIVRIVSKNEKKSSRGRCFKDGQYHM